MPCPRESSLIETSERCEQLVQKGEQDKNVIFGLHVDKILGYLCNDF